MSKYEQNSKVSTRPWNLSHDIDNDTMDIIDNNGFTVIEDFQFSSSLSDEDAEHIIHCVNEHDSLVAEVEQLKEIIWKLIKALKSAEATTEYSDYARDWRKIITEAEDMV